MNETTFFLKETATDQSIINVEHILAGMKGIEKVSVDTTDGEVKVEFDHTKISRERIAITLQQHNFNIQ
ncbi:heavy-metal-associated domain-containing protein [Priestia abyssalis]|uniref:heavy-metal-associated domain-containing protein n=1 Tax=Priestia abyssalis TaxID=1221450 RepID=UPI0009959865|nr:heavy metal-associated domain-containing protein [Priestia abyssalis]